MMKKYIKNEADPLINKKLKEFSEFLLEKEMMLAQAISEIDTVDEAFSWVNHIRHEFDKKFNLEKKKET